MGAELAVGPMVTAEEGPLPVQGCTMWGSQRDPWRGWRHTSRQWVAGGTGVGMGVSGTQRRGEPGPGGGESDGRTGGPAVGGGEPGGSWSWGGAGGRLVGAVCRAGAGGAMEGAGLPSWAAEAQPPWAKPHRRSGLLWTHGLGRPALLGRRAGEPEAPRSALLPHHAWSRSSGEGRGQALRLRLPWPTSDWQAQPGRPPPRDKAGQARAAATSVPTPRGRGCPLNRGERLLTEKPCPWGVSSTGGGVVVTLRRPQA